MKKYFRKLAVAIAMTLTITTVPYTAKAAAAPDFKTYYTNLYENGAGKGVYTYSVLNVKKGYKVKWSISGTGKAYGTLKYASTTAKATTSSNKITIATKKATAAKNKKITLTAKVFDTKNKLVKTIKDDVVIKIQATGVNIVTTKVTDDLTALSVGKAYDFDQSLSPSNATSTTYWTVNDEAGADCTSQITTAGIFTPKSAGKYIITATVRNSKSGAVLATKSISVTAGVSVTDVAQTAANKFRVIFNADVSKVISADDFTVNATNGTSSVMPKEVYCSVSGKIVTVTNHTNFKDGVSYTVTYGNTSKAFVASVGVAKTIKILTDSVEANKATEIEYGVYDSNNMDVTSAVSGTFSFEESIITNGYFDSENKLFMTTAGKTGTIVLTYKDETNNITLRTTKVVACVEPKAVEATSTNFTITNSSSTPGYDVSGYKDNTSVALGDTAYAHFRALDSNKKEITYSSIKLDSSDSDKLIIDNDGRLTPIKAGTVKVTVTATDSGKDTTYVYTVTILAKRQASYVKLSSTNITMSNAYVTDYEEYIGVEIYDQHNVALDLSKATCTIKESSNKIVLADYDDANKRIVVKAQGMPAGTYNYTAAFVLDGTTVNTGFNVIIKAVPSTGSYGYTAAIDYQTLDVVVDSDTVGDKLVTAKVREMINGIFAGYKSCYGVTVKKDGLYYGNDLTEEGSKTEIAVNVVNGTDINLTALKINTAGTGVGESKKAKTGVYTITMKYTTNTGGQATAGINFTIKDSQSVPGYTIKSLTSSKTVNTALALVNDCISFADGTAYDCTVAGTTQTGDAVSVSSGQKKYIDTVSIKSVVNISNSKKVYVYYTLNLGKTLTNKG